MAETAVGLDDTAFIDGLWHDWSLAYNGSQDIASAKDALRDPANLGAAIGYYRAMLGATAPDRAHSAEAAAAADVAPQPTLFLHGDRDGSTADELYTDAAAFTSPGSKIEIVAGIGHFFHVEKPAAVNRLILDWVTAQP